MEVINITNDTPTILKSYYEDEESQRRVDSTAPLQAQDYLKKENILKVEPT